MKDKKVLVMSTLLVAIVLLGIGTIAYFRRTVDGNITGNTGNLVLIVNEANAVENESFSISLNRSEEEPYIMPDDKGTFDINIDSTGSSTDVDVTIIISRTNLPDNLKFYLDENYTKELTTKTYVLKKSDDMRVTVPVYWFWDGSVDDENDSIYMGETLEAYVSVSAIIHVPTFYETLLESSYTLDTNIDFDLASSSTNGIGLMMRNGTQNDEYPIFYYRGDVSNNNVIFAGRCWLIVRTTETGGIKLVFNGPVVENDDGSQSCTNYSGVGGGNANTSYFDVYANSSSYSSSYSSPIYVGYMNNNAAYAYSKDTLTTDYKSHMLDNTIDLETGKHIQNLNNSIVKRLTDNWYKSNLLGKSEETLIEDTVWCNDRSIISETYSLENYASDLNSYFSFGARTRIQEDTLITPSLSCDRVMDQFTVNSENGNGDLDYSIGLLTADEINFVGHPYGTSTITYLSLSSGSYQWTLSPNYFVEESCMFVLGSSLGVAPVTAFNYGIRPAISLKNNVIFTSGNGEFATPYIVG